MFSQVYGQQQMAQKLLHLKQHTKLSYDVQKQCAVDTRKYGMLFEMDTLYKWHWIIKY